MEMRGNCCLKLGLASSLPLPLYLYSLYEYVKESICESGQTGLFQFIAWDAKCPIAYTLQPIHCTLEKTIQYSKKQYYSWLLDALFKNCLKKDPPNTYESIKSVQCLQLSLFITSKFTQCTKRPGNSIQSNKLKQLILEICANSHHNLIIEWGRWEGGERNNKVSRNNYHWFTFIRLFFGFLNFFPDLKVSCR